MILVAQALGQTAVRALTPGARLRLCASYRQGCVARSVDGSLIVLSDSPVRAPWLVNILDLPGPSPHWIEKELIVEADGCLWFEHTQLRIWMHSALHWEPEHLHVTATAEQIRRRIASLLSAWPPPSLRDEVLKPFMTTLLEAVKSGDLGCVSAAAEPLIGLGRGLTPAGDDLLTGLAGTIALLTGEMIVLDVAGRTTALSSVQLQHAPRGELIEPLHGMIVALVSTRERVMGAKERLLGLGHSSGADMLAGLWLGFVYALAKGF